MAWPILAIGARTFPIIFNQRAMYRASLLGYDLSKIMESLKSGLQGMPDPCRYALVMQLLAVCTSHVFTSAVPREEPWTAEQWVDFIDAVVPDEGRAEVMGKIMQAVMAAVVKHSSDRKTKTVPSPTTEATTVKEESVQ